MNLESLFIGRDLAEALQKTFPDKQKRYAVIQDEMDFDIKQELMR